MPFWIGYQMTNFLFCGINTTTPFDMFLTSLGVFTLAVMTEGIQAWINWAKAHYKSTGSTAEVIPLLLRHQIVVQRRARLRMKTVVGFLHGIRVGSTFLLMLSVMSFSVWIFVAAVLGITLGWRWFHIKPHHLSPPLQPSHQLVQDSMM